MTDNGVPTAASSLAPALLGVAILVVALVGTLALNERTLSSVGVASSNDDGGFTPLPTVAPTEAPSTPEPTALPEPTVVPTLVPPPTPVPSPTPVPRPAPLVLTPNTDGTPTSEVVGPVVVPLPGLPAFALSRAHPVLQIPGHTLIYLDDTLAGEVDLFTIDAGSDGQPISSFADATAAFELNPAFADMAVVGDRTIAGFRAVGYTGSPVQLQLGFYTSPNRGETDGWYTPGLLEIWFIDGPRGIVAVTAEALAEDSDRYGQSLRLLDEVLDTLEFTDPAG